MVGFVDTGCALEVTSWGWTDAEGRPAQENATMRVWKVTADGELLGFLVLSGTIDAAEVMEIASGGFVLVGS